MCLAVSTSFTLDEVMLAYDKSNQRDNILGFRGVHPYAKYK